MTRVGVVGLGMLGGAVAMRLLDRGADVTVYNRTADKTQRARQGGARVAGSPWEVAAASDVVITVVRDADAVRAVSFGDGGIVDGAHDGLVVADMSTIDPSESRDMTAEFSRHGIAKLDIPVMGGPNVAIKGDLVMMVSGDRGVFERHCDLLGTVARKVSFLGGPGTAHTVKLAMNMQITMLALGLSEGIALLKKAGVDPEAFLGVLNSTYFRTGMSEGKAYGMIAGWDGEDGAGPPTFTLANLKKDITTMTRAAGSLGVRLPMTERAEEVYGRAAREGFGGLDYTGIVQYIKRINEPARGGDGSSSSSSSGDGS